MKNTLIILIGLLLFSTCNKTDGFNLVTDLNGQWLLENNSDVKTYYTFIVDKNVLLKLNIQPYDPLDDTDPVPTAMDYKYEINGSAISIYDSPYPSLEKSNSRTYIILSNKEKNKIILKNKNNKNNIILIKQ